MEIFTSVRISYELIENFPVRINNITDWVLHEYLSINNPLFLSGLRSTSVDRNIIDCTYTIHFDWEFTHDVVDLFLFTHGSKFSVYQAVGAIRPRQGADAAPKPKGRKISV